MTFTEIVSYIAAAVFALTGFAGGALKASEAGAKPWLALLAGIAAGSAFGAVGLLMTSNLRS